MPSLLFITGIILIAIPLIVMIAMAGVIFVSFIKDDDDVAGIAKLALLIMAAGVVFVVLDFILKMF